MFNPGSIQIKEGTWAPTCTTDSNLTENQMKAPAIRDFVEHTNQRMLSTLLVSGAANKYGLGYVPTKIGKVDDKKLIGNNAYQFDVWTRLQKKVNIVAQIGSTQADGTFQISTVEDYWYPGMNVLFHGQGYQARVMSGPTGSAGNYVWTLQSPDGALFSWATHVAPQGSSKTAMGGYSSYGEKSLRGYGRSHFPDSFIQHMTIQRKTTGISGGANSNVLWYEWVNPQTNAPVRGWRYEAERQNDIVFMQEDEYQKWDGISTMKNADGTLRSTSRLRDLETGLPIIHGDGLMQQIGGGNETDGSGTNGEATADDIIDMMKAIRKKSNMISGLTHVVVTGEDGFSNAQRVMPILSGSQNVQLVQNVNQTSAAGGVKVDVGFNFQSFNVDGDQVLFIKHPMFDNEDLYTERGSDGNTLKSSQYVFLTTMSNGKKNMEILSKGARGINRSLVTGYLNGLSGDEGLVLSEEDAIKYAQLKENMMVVYNSNLCGIINKSA